MDYNDLVNKWLFVAYSAKSDGTEDKNSTRSYAGNKGVGRFSCDRVGGFLKLQAKTRKAKEVHSLEVNWQNFERDSKERFDDVSVSHYTSDEFYLPKELNNLEHGVVLEISALRDPESWDRSKLLKLKNHLAKLVNPFGDANSNIDIKLHCTREEEADRKISLSTQDQVSNIIVNGSIYNTIFETLKSKTTWLSVKLIDNAYFETSLIDRGDLIYKIQEPLGNYEELIDSSFDCQLFYLNRSAKQTFSTRMSLASVNFGSVFLFRNSFRVYPVGEPGDDYWQIDKRHQQGYARTIGTRDVMGRVNIAGPESKFKESSSRDRGLVETPASIQLYDCVLKKCLKRLETYVVGITWQDKIDKDYDTTQRLELDENRSRIIELVTKLSDNKDITLVDYNKNLIDVFK